ncbi:MAG: helix-turn-helix transcriptional regulator [Oscillospiraceae bacterium]|nr:helix-turn-helix transcriptional regulator [Oscillospiraceae bacterium]
MAELNKEKFGAFVSQLRKEKGLTQKGLAEKLHVTDKAVSKWERGLSLPDVALLSPLAEALGVTVAELLKGARLQTDQALPVTDADQLVHKVIDLSAQEQRRTPPFRRKAALPFFLALLVGGAEFLLLNQMGYFWDTLNADIFVYFLLSVMFGAYFCLFSKERLPDYYDQHTIGPFYDGPFRMYIPGVHFNNRNWPHILQVGQRWCMAVLVGSPVLYWLLTQLFPSFQTSPAKYIQLAVVLIGLLVPMWFVGRKYE